MWENKAIFKALLILLQVKQTVGGVPINVNCKLGRQHPHTSFKYLEVRRSQLKYI